MSKQIKAIGFDWDGTLVDSMSVKAEAFASSIISFYPAIKREAENIRSAYFNTRGKSRIEQLKLVQKAHHLPELSAEERQKWSEKFTRSYIHTKLPLFDDTLPVLEELTKRGYRIFLSSSVPQEDLDETLKSYPELTGSFEFAYGTRGIFRKGLPHLTSASERLKINPENIAFAGDSPYDVQAANESKAYSIGKANPDIPETKTEIAAANPKLLIERLSELLQHFRKTQ